MFYGYAPFKIIDFLGQMFHSLVHSTCYMGKVRQDQQLTKIQFLDFIKNLIVKRSLILAMKVTKFHLKMVLAIFTALYFNSEEFFSSNVRALNFQNIFQNSIRESRQISIKITV